MKKIVHSSDAPAPVGPYNQAVLFSTKESGTLYISGQIAIDPATGNLIQDSIEAETHQVLKNLGAILQAAGLDYSHVLKCSVFVKDMNLYSHINAVYAEYFPEDQAPARELVEVSQLPKSVNIEISAIAAN